MQRILVRGIIAAAACSALLLAADVWKTKDFSQWTAEDAVKVLTDSPWAKQKTVPVGRQASSDHRYSKPGRGGGGGGGMAAGRHGGAAHDDGDSIPGRSEMISVTVRWESALPIQQALARQEQAAKPSESYVVAVMGALLPRSEVYGDDDSLDAAKNQEHMRDLLLDAGQLIVRGKMIPADDVRLEGRNGSIAMRYIFPKSLALSADDREVTFTFDSHGVKFDHKFHLPDMVYQGKLSL